MTKKRILITVKTYPTPSSKYEELVCTAGFDGQGNWVRIYPLPYRKLPYNQQYKKYHWIEIDLVKNKKDFRPESYRPKNIDAKDAIAPQDYLGTKNNWSKRKSIVLKNVYYDIGELIEKAKGVNTSLAVFKPKEILRFVSEYTGSEWNDKQKSYLQQQNLFDSKGDFKILNKLPYKFCYEFIDKKDKKSKLQIIDWEIGALFWSCLKRNSGDGCAACDDVKKKYYNDFAKTKDLYFFLGTTLQYHSIAPNPFMIIGTFHPKKERMLKLNL